eukprot:2209656-Heterocapsa_arctica.AAC.1
MVCLYRLAHRSPQSGGLRSTVGQSLARDLLRALLVGAAAGRTWRVQIRLVDGWKAAWPCTEEFQAEFNLLADDSLIVDLSPWRDTVSAGHALATTWWTSVVAGSEAMRDG